MSTEAPDFDGSIALIRHPEHGEGVWLGVPDRQRRNVTLIAASRLDGESYRECLDREIAWELSLDRGRDYIISSVARLHFSSTVRLPEQDASLKVETEFFVVDLYGDRGKQRVESNAATQWLTSSELLTGQLTGGQTVSRFTTALLRAADVITDSSHQP